MELARLVFVHTDLTVAEESDERCCSGLICLIDLVGYMCTGCVVSCHTGEEEEQMSTLDLFVKPGYIAYTISNSLPTWR